MILGKPLKIIKTVLGVKSNFPGAKRIWLEGKRLSQSGFNVGCRYMVSDDGNRLSLAVSNVGDKKVSRKSRRCGDNPIIDLTSKFIAEKFTGFNTVKIVFFKDHISIMPDPREVAINESKKMLSLWAKKGKFPCIDIFTGGATSSMAIHEATEGQLETIQHIEGNAFYCDYADMNHPDSLSMQGWVQDMDMGDILKAAVAFIWWPCTDHSTQGRAKKGISKDIHPESGQFGYLSHYALDIVRAANVPVVVGECVPSYQNSAAMAITRNVLRDQGYIHQDEAILEAPAFGGLTTRKRFIFMASRLGPVSIPRDDVKADRSRKLADILEDENTATWHTEHNNKTINYFVNVHGKKHGAKGNGFGIEKNSVLPSADYMPTIPATYGKFQPAGLLQKGEGIAAWRQFTPQEVLKAHRLENTGIILPDSKTRQYEILGQGTEGGMVRAIGKLVLNHLREHAGNVAELLSKQKEQQVERRAGNTHPRNKQLSLLSECSI